jgi:linoleoyl-CoA desaturase
MTPHPEYGNAIWSLRRDIASRGLCRKAPAAVILQLIVHLMLALGGFGIIVATRGWLLGVTGLVLSTIGTAGVATNTHTSSHFATSEKKWINRVLTYFGYPFFLQLSSTYWHHKHIVHHHQAPNVVGVDEDIDWAPLFALTEIDMQQGSGFRLMRYQAQWFIAPLAIAWNAFNVQYFSWAFVLHGLLDPRTRGRAYWLDLILMLLHWLFWLVLPMLVFAPGKVLLAYGLRMIMLGYALFAILAPAHFPAEAVVVDSARGIDYMFLQTAATVNFRTGSFGAFFCSGLDHQIEHHLFPNVSHVIYPRIKSIVRAFCEEHGYPYRCLGWGEAIWKSLDTFRRPKRVQRNLVHAGSRNSI